jgi:hypothetical protein
MDRIAITLDENGNVVGIRADAEVEVYLVSPSVPRDRVYRWSSLRVGRDDVDEEIGGWPIGDKDHWPWQH